MKKLQFFVGGLLPPLFVLGLLAVVAPRVSSNPSPAPAPPVIPEPPLAFDPKDGGPGEEGFTSLFDGKSLDGWEGDHKFWSVEDGAITGRTTKENPSRKGCFLIWRGGEVADFELRLRCRIVGNNSGIQYRSKDLGDGQVSGYQADFGPGESHNGKLYEEGGRAGLAYPGQKVVIHPGGRKEVVGTFGNADELKRGLPENQWLEYVIIARGPHLLHGIDGRTMIEATDNDPAKRALSGILALQIHGGEPMTVQFKDLRLRRRDGQDSR